MPAKHGIPRTLQKAKRNHEITKAHSGLNNIPERSRPRSAEMCYQTAGRDAERRRNDTVQHPDHRPKTEYTSVRQRQVRGEQRWGKRQVWRVQRWGVSSTACFLTPQGASHCAPFPDRKKKEEKQHSTLLPATPPWTVLDVRLCPSLRLGRRALGAWAAITSLAGRVLVEAPPPHGGASLAPTCVNLFSRRPPK